MGNSQQIVYSVPLSKYEDTKGETPVHRRPDTVNGLLSVPDAETKTMQDVYLRAAKKYAAKDFIMSRLPSNEKGELQPYVSINYGQGFEIAKSLGKGINSLGLTQPLREYLNYEMKFVGVYSKNRKEWILLDQACGLFGYTLVPIYDSLGPDATEFVFFQTNLTTLFCTANYVEAITKLKSAGKTSKLQTLVIMDMPTLTEEYRQKFAASGVKLLAFDEVVEAGRKVADAPYPPVKPSDICCLSYTSGTTGNPKAAMLSHANIMGAITVIQSNMYSRFLETDVVISYLPLPHVLERLSVATQIYAGCTLAMFNGDVNKLKEDIAEVRPTIFVSVPRLYNRFHDAIKKQFSELEGLKKTLADQAVSTKLQNCYETGAFTHCFYDALIFSKVRAIFGGRLRLMACGSAPIDPGVFQFLKVAFCCSFMEGYGQTESSGASFFNDPYDGHPGTVGGPTHATEFKLVDVPEMNYSSKDRNEAGHPQPRGEICMRGPMIFPGYYKDPDKTAEALDKDGWLHSGDVGTILPNGSLKIIDRKKNIFKLQQGEYIAPEKIEAVLALSQYVAEVFVYGDSLKNHLVGVIFPKEAGLKQLAAANNISDTTLDALCKNEALKGILVKELEKHCKGNKLLGFEVLKAIHLIPDTMANSGLFTPSMKLKRNEAKVFYKDVLNQLYAASGSKD